MHRNEIKSGRALITPDVAREIYMYSQERIQAGSTFSPTSVSAALGAKYGITAKAVRDIWNKRTWSHATYLLWTDEDKRIYKQKVDSFDRQKLKAEISSQDVHVHTKMTDSLPTEHRKKDEGGARSEVRSAGSKSSFSDNDEGIAQASVGSHSDSQCAVVKALPEVAKQPSRMFNDAWMMCPDRIGLFLSERPEIQFTSDRVAIQDTFTPASGKSLFRVDHDRNQGPQL
ncbi:hypothetical protein GUITHDRAFT_115905 [Guillardia theta CCMP2712]|uniref:Uncharacterized protein n=1 Tax=Guillardia theta (strain CCMP2712) TaxID=905079 RepID=L1INU8_GUITC|nr:hypothetical protein GUITHDRAFT_115905 [Guillardia theta CCMP2712]EKX37933.1 hypothetical protein GUITHDRAFT_115905 [Guillardia theta CCMP2712]|eukprot:XP_005824913.1 hypothetical protein GUITHDRAFT_115905 [Guillardia theta CCMP2712]